MQANSISKQVELWDTLVYTDWCLPGLSVVYETSRTNRWLIGDGGGEGEELPCDDHVPLNEGALGKTVYQIICKNLLKTIENTYLLMKILAFLILFPRTM